MAIHLNKNSFKLLEDTKEYKEKIKVVHIGVSNGSEREVSDALRHVHLPIYPVNNDIRSYHLMAKGLFRRFLRRMLITGDSLIIQESYVDDKNKLKDVLNILTILADEELNSQVW